MSLVAPSESSSNYEYVTARVRSRRAQLFGSEDYSKLVRMGTGEIARYMEDGAYEAEMNALGARYDGVDLIEYALNQDLAEQFDDLLGWAEGQLRAYLVRYLRKFDAWNLKTVIRGLYAETPATEVEDDLIRAGEFSAERLDGLLEAASIQEAVEQAAGTIFGAAVTAAYDEYESTGSLVPLENAIDRCYYERLLESVPREADGPTGLYVEFLRAEIDFSNLRSVLRVARSGAELDPEAYFIEGGRLFGAADLRAMGGSIEEIVARLRESPYGAELGESLERLETAESLIGFEYALDAALVAYSDRLSNRFPLSVCPVLAYILAKEREVDNVRAVARGREAGLDEETIRTELVL
jgi:V/A-type H+-transporting ATPase subunit C